MSAAPQQHGDGAHRGSQRAGARVGRTIGGGAGNSMGPNRLLAYRQARKQHLHGVRPYGMPMRATAWDSTAIQSDRARPSALLQPGGNIGGGTQASGVSAVSGALSSSNTDRLQIVKQCGRGSNTLLRRYGRYASPP
jgi:hypothetical protein